MHGTYVEDKKILAHERRRLYDEDLVKFGSEVTRGPGTCIIDDQPASFCSHRHITWLLSLKTSSEDDGLTFLVYPESFPPLHVLVQYSWVDERYLDPRACFYSHTDAMTSSFGGSQNSTRMSQAALLPNVFQVPDCDDEENDEGDHISFVQEKVIKPKPEVVLPPPPPPPTRIPQGSGASCGRDAISIGPGQGLDSAHSNPSSAPANFGLNPVARPQEPTTPSPSPGTQLSVAASGPSGLSEAEREADKQAMDLQDHTTSSTGTSMSADVQSPAKSNSSLPTSSQSKRSDEHLDMKSNACANHRPTSEPRGLKEVAIIVDDDLTQSEYDSDEPFSTDLIVDDSEDGQRHDPPTDYGSDSDEDALLTAEKCRSKSPHPIEDSTDSESSRSDLSDDIGMERDEDFFVHSESKLTISNLPLPTNDSTEYNKINAEQESISYNMRPGNFTAPSSRLSLPSNPLNRAPSPSDAALAKSTDFTSGGTGNPGALYPNTYAQSWSNPAASAYSSAWPCTFDGRPHVPYDERFGGFQYSYGVSCAPGQPTSDSFRTFISPMSMPPDQSFNSDTSAMKQSDRPNGNGSSCQPQSQLQPISPISMANTQSKVDTEVVPPPSCPDKNAAKVSIKSIVEHVSEEPPSTQNHTDLKRKADDMCRDSVVDLARDSSNDAIQAEDYQPSICHPQPKSVSAAQVMSLQSLPFMSDTEGERPAKRARTRNEAGRTSYATLAATALAGAVVGGVGVVAALVSLPQDFFV